MAMLTLKCASYPREKDEGSKDKMMELNHYDKDDNPRYGWDVYVQRMYVFFGVPYLKSRNSRHVSGFSTR